MIRLNIADDVQTLT